MALRHGLRRCRLGTRVTTILWLKDQLPPRESVLVKGVVSQRVVARALMLIVISIAR